MPYDACSFSCQPAPIPAIVRPRLIWSIVHKAFAARDLDWADVAGIIMRQGPKLRIAQIWEELRPLLALKEEPEIAVKLQRLFDRHLD